MASVTDTVASTLAREAAKIGASKALGKPIDSIVDAIGDLGVAVIGDRSPGALGRGTERPLTESELNNYEMAKGDNRAIKSTLDTDTRHGLAGRLGERIFDKHLTDTVSVFKYPGDKKVTSPPTSWEAAQKEYFTPAGRNLKAKYAQALGATPEEATAHAMKGTPLPGFRGKPSIREDNFYLEGHRQKTSDNPVMDFAYQHPEAIGHAITYGAPVAAGAVALGLGHYFTSKPRSDYALGLSGLGPSTGNSNIDAARASAYYQQETAELKFQHQMALQQARADAQTPGRQRAADPTGLPPSLGGGNARDAYQMAMSLVNTPTPIYK
jgi:hypothetical protein